MKKNKKKPHKRFLSQLKFEEIDHRLSCGWHVEIEESVQRKKYLSLKKESVQQFNDEQNKIRNSEKSFKSQLKLY